MRHRLLMWLISFIAIGWIGFVVLGERDRTQPAQSSTAIEQMSDRSGRDGSSPTLVGRIEGARGKDSVARGFATGMGAIVGTLSRGDNLHSGTVELRFSCRLPSEDSSLSMQQRVAAEIAIGGDLTPLPGPPLKTAHSDRDGRFRFEGLCAGHYELRTSHTDEPIVRSRVWLHSDDAVANVALAIPHGTMTLRGRAIYEDGTPFRGWVVVRASETGTSRSAHRAAFIFASQDREVHTDGRGRFTVTHLSTNHVSLSLMNFTHTSYTRDRVRFSPNKELVVTVPRLSDLYRGQLISTVDGSPVPDAIVFGVTGSAFERVGVFALADQEGKFELPVFDDGGSGNFHVRADGFAPKAFNQPSTTLLEATHVIRMSPVGSVRGRVIDATGNGVEGVNVIVLQLPSEATESVSTASATSTKGGHFLVEHVAPGKILIVAQGNGYVSGVGTLFSIMNRDLDTMQDTQQLESEGVLESDVLVVRAAKVTGRVTNERGEPIEGALVRFHASHSGTLSVSSVGEPTSVGESFVVTGADGTFTLTDVVPDEPQRLSVEASGFPRHLSQEIRTTSGQTSRVDVVLPLGRTVSVTVTRSRTNEPLKDVEVYLKATPEEGRDERLVFGNGQVGTTDADGVVVFADAPHGELKVHVDDVAYAKTEPYTLSADQHAVAIKLEPGYSVYGTIEMPSDVEIRNLRVYAVESNAKSEGTRRVVHVFNESSFRIGRLKAGSVELRATATSDEWRYEAKKTVDAGSSGVNLVLKKSHKRERLLVRVVDPNNKPVTHGTVQVHYTARNGDEAEVSGDLTGGQVVLDVSDVSAHGTFAVYVKGLPDDLAPIHVSPPGGFPPSGELILRARKGESIIGRVVGDGQGLADIQITARRIDDADSSLLVFGDSRGWVVTGRDGKFVILGLNPGKYQLFLSGTDDWMPPAAEIELSTGQRSALIQMVPAVSATLTVVDEDGRPIENARASTFRSTEALVIRFDQWGGGFVLETNNLGKITLGSLDPSGTYRLEVEPPNDLRARYANRVIQEWRPKDETITLKRSYFIAGHVADADGRPVGPGVVRAHSAQSDQQADGKLNERGRFRITGVPEGTYNVSVVPDGLLEPVQLLLSHSHRSSKKAYSVELYAGNEDVEIRASVDPPMAITLSGISDMSFGEMRQIYIGNTTGYQVRHNLKVQRPIGRDRDVYRLYGFAPDATYAVGAYGSVDGRYFLRRGVLPGESVTIEPKNGGPLKGSIKLPAGVQLSHVMVRIHLPTGPYDFGVGAVTKFSKDGFPPGTWRVAITAHTRDGEYQKTLDATIDESFDVTLKKSK